ncbi:hypothetical protein ACO2JO_06350 [Leptospira interrogans]|jgi:hypothetical protein
MSGPRPAGRPWTLTDDDQLRKLLVSGMAVTLIALKMKRSIGAIYSRKNFLKKARKK